MTNFIQGSFKNCFPWKKRERVLILAWHLGPRISKYAGHCLTQSKSDLFVFGETEFGEVFFIAVSVLRQIETSVKI